MHNAGQNARHGQMQPPSAQSVSICFKPRNTLKNVNKSLQVQKISLDVSVTNFNQSFPLVHIEGDLMQWIKVLRQTAILCLKRAEYFFLIPPF